MERFCKIMFQCLPSLGDRAKRSEDKAELDRFCNAMLNIREEIAKVEAFPRLEGRQMIMVLAPK